jgi:AraC-like DNA-binding protein
MVTHHTHGYALDTTWRTLLKDLGVVPANVLRRAGMPDDLLQQPSVRLPSEDYYRLWDASRRRRRIHCFLSVCVSWFVASHSHRCCLQHCVAAKRVRAALHEALPSGLVAMESIARKLALSKRTLQRRIEAEGTSYQKILQETREALARHYLEKTALPVAEISLLLGFDEPNSFYRAFRQWTSTTPESVRQARNAILPAPT